MKLYKLFLIFFIVICSVGYSKEYQMRCASELSTVLDKVESLPEGKELIFKVLEQGPLSIKVNNIYPDQFEGYWGGHNRTIYITKKRDSSDCSLVTTLLFELHNAVRTAAIKEVQCLVSNNQMNRTEFIQAIEYIEYENALSTTKLLNLGVKDGIFPRYCHWNIAGTFEEHYRIQREAGHSEWIGKMYDDLVS